MKILTMSRDEHKHAFFCPGCGFAHWFKTDGNGWTWNGDRDKPTISPSILTLGVEPRCHSFVTDGRIRFLDDCTHKLKGRTVELPEFPGASASLDPPVPSANTVGGVIGGKVKR